MRFKLTIVLILLNVALFGVIFYLERESASEYRFTKEHRLVLAPGLVEDADSLRIEGPQMPNSWVLSRKADEWLLIEPVQWPANYFAVNRILNQLKFLEWETRFSVDEIKKSGRSLADYGLDKPKVVLTIKRAEKETHITIGESTQIGNRLYILSPDQTEVYVINRELLDSISVDFGELRSQNIFNIPLFEVRSISMQRSTDQRNPTLRLTRGQDGWRFESPIQIAADSQRVEGVINNLNGLRVISFHPPDSAAQGLSNPSMRLTLEGNNRRQTILLGNSVSAEDGPPQYYAKLSASPAVFSVPAASFDSFWETQENLRDKKFALFDPLKLTTIEIGMADRNVTLQKLETGAWQVLQVNADGGLDSWPADPKVTAEVIRELSEVEAQRFVSNAPSASDLNDYGLVEPQRRIVLRSEEESVLLLGDFNLEEKLIYSKLAAEPYVYMVETDLLHLLEVSALHYRQRILEEQPPAARIQSILLRNLEEERTTLELSIEPSVENWPDLLKDYPEEKREAILSLLENLRRFEVKDYIRNTFSDVFQLDAGKALPWKFQLTAGINLPGGSEAQLLTRTYFFTERVGGTTQFGGSPHHHVVFRVNQNMLDALFPLTFESNEPDLDSFAPSEIEPTQPVAH